jgi:hypothetical protein
VHFIACVPLSHHVVLFFKSAILYSRIKRFLMVISARYTGYLFSPPEEAKSPNRL